MANSTIGKKLAGIFVLCAALAMALCLVACGGGSAGKSAAAGTYKDGTYTGESKVLKGNVDGDGYGAVEIVVKDGKISDVTYQSYLPDGTLKDSNYGKGSSNYSLAQKIVSTTKDYADALVQAGTPDGVDVISGATFMHDQFVEASNNALEKAKA